MTSAAAQDLDTTSADTSPLEAAPPAAIAAPEEAAPAAILRGGAQGLEILVDARATIDAIAAAITERLALAPAFFRNTDVRIRVDHGPLARGCLARLDELAGGFELRIVEIAPARRPGIDRRASAAPALEAVVEAPPPPAPEPTPTVEVAAEAPAQVEPPPEPDAEPDDEPDDETPRPEGTRIVVGPVRSGVILEHGSHIIVFGDVNPGAEIRAGGSIAVMGRLRGTAHAGIGGRDGFILALRLQPQQLRIGRIVARAGDSDTPAAHAEIAHVAESTIIVEEYRGRLPSQLVASLQEEIHG